MSMRAGSLGGVLRELDSESLKLLLEDYALARRRERASRADFAAGWVAAMRRFGLADQGEEAAEAA